jgi:hypothetical protein
VRPDIAGKVEQLKQGVAREGIDPGRVFYYEAYPPHFKGLALRLDEFSVKLKAYGGRQSRKHPGIKQDTRKDIRGTREDIKKDTGPERNIGQIINRSDL